MTNRRIGIRINPREVLSLIELHYELVSGEEFPNDMEYAGATYDFDTNTFCIKVISDTFNVVSQGRPMPYLDIKKK